MRSLRDLTVRHGSDKYGIHDYIKTYDRLLTPLRNEALRILEIGIGGYESATEGGASLAMWRDFFPRAKIVGVDVFEKDFSLGPNVTCLRGSQSDRDFMTRVNDDYGPFNIIIDDGSHINSDVIGTFEHMFPLLADAGYYFIEDTQTAFFEEFGGAFIQSADLTAGYFAKVFVDIDHSEILARYSSSSSNVHANDIVALHRYHNMIMVEKGLNSFPSSFAFTKIDDHRRSEILSVLTTTRGACNHNRLGVLFDFLMASGMAKRAASVLNSIKRLPPLPRSYYRRAIVLAKAENRLADASRLEDELAQFDGEATSGHEHG